MNWRSELQIIDFGEGQMLEVTCRRCGHTRYESTVELSQRPGLEFAYLDEVERALTCHRQACRGEVRIAIVADDDTEGFVGGLA